MTEIDRFFTPYELVKASIDKLKTIYPLFNPMSVLEPGCGVGSHLDAANNVFNIVQSIGIDTCDDLLNSMHQKICGNYLTYSDTKFDFIATNPPFSLIERFFLKAKEDLNPDGLGMFLGRLDLLGSIKRYEGLWKLIHLLGIIVCVPRPSFINTMYPDNQTAPMDYCYYVFDSAKDGYNKQYFIDWVRWR
jgi:hypothetical protein